MNTILVTGATGNVGRAVVAELRARGADVRAFVRDERRAHDVLGADVALVRTVSRTPPATGHRPARRRSFRHHPCCSRRTRS